MIIDPDMPDHWKVQMLAGMLGDDPAAPVYLIRLWGHCQSRKKDHFEKLPAVGLRAICKFPGDAQEFEAALLECGFIEREDGGVTIVGWADHNANLWSAWENGKKGGRPKKPKENPRDNPEENPRDTHRTPDEWNEGDEGDEGDEIPGDESPERSKRKTRLPKNFKISDRVKDWAERKGYKNLEVHHENFVNQARAKGYTYIDWDSAFMNAIRNDWAKIGQDKSAADSQMPDWIRGAK